MKKFQILCGSLVLAVNVFAQNFDAMVIQSFDPEHHYFVFRENNSQTSRKASTLGTENTFPNPDYFGLKKENALKLKKTTNNGQLGSDYEYNQLYKNVPVEGSQFYIHADQNGNMKSANGDIYSNIELDVLPSVTGEQAISAALNYSNASKYYWQDPSMEKMLKESKQDPGASYYPIPELVILPLSSTNYALCYKLTILSRVPEDAYILYVNANNLKVEKKTGLIHNCSNSPNGDGKAPVVESCGEDCAQGIAAPTLYYQNQYIYTERFTHTFFGCEYRLIDRCGSKNIRVHKANGSDYLDDGNYWDWESDKPGTTALWTMERTYEYYTTLGRNSYDNAYHIIQVATEDPNLSPQDQAAWDAGTQTMRIGIPGSTYFNNHPATLDIIGHEFTHAVTDNEANLNYQGESGALDESFADIFGTMVEFYGKSNYSTGLSPNYLIGEECAIGGKLRDMANPNSKNQADTYGGSFWVDPNSQNDHGGVHYNSGVQNFWFYLLSEGGSGTNDLNNQYCVSAIGRDKASYIAYRSLTTYLTPSSNFSDARYYSIQSAIDLYGAGSNEVAQVTQAWYAVGVGAAFTGPITIANKTYNGATSIAYNSNISMSNITITSTANVSISSASKITVSPTSSASSGSFMHLFIQPGCTGGARPAGEEGAFSYDQYGEDLKIDHNQATAAHLNSNKFGISPNPSNGVFTISMDDSNESSTISIYSLLGNKVFEKLRVSEKQLNVDLSNQPNGIYYVKIIFGDKVETQKIVKQ